MCCFVCGDIDLVDSLEGKITEGESPIFVRILG